MKILFIYMDSELSHNPSFHYGIGFMASLLKQRGHEIKLVHFIKKKDEEKVFKEIKEFNPKLIAFSSVTSQFEGVKNLAKKIKRENNAIIICGGIHVSLVPESLSSNDLDGICIGEGEYAILELVENIENNRNWKKTKNFWFKDNNKIIKNPIRNLINNLDELPMPDRSIFNYQRIINNDNKIARFIFNRGCPFNCSYCANHALQKIKKGKGKYLRFRSVDKAIEEILEIKKKYKFNKISFDDETMSYNKKWFLDFLKAYKEKINMPFNCSVRVNSIDEETIKELKKANCEFVGIGIESGNDDIRNNVLKRNMSKEDIKKTFKLAHDAKLKTTAFLMVGLPYENKKKFMDTIKLVKEIKPTTVHLNIFYPYPGTKLGDLCWKNGWVKVRKSKDIVDIPSYNILNLPDFSRKDIDYYYKHFNKLIFPFGKRSYYDLQNNKIIHIVLKNFYKIIPFEIKQNIKKIIIK